MKKICTIAVLLFSTCWLSAQTAATDDSTGLTDRGYIVEIGDPVPNVNLVYTDGTTIPVSSLRGKIVLLQFTASWCSVCREEMPHLEKEIWQAYKSKGLVFAGVDLKEPVAKVKKFAKTMKITYPLTLDTEGKTFYSFAAEGAGVTRNVLIDKQGKIVYLTRLYDATEFEGLKQKVKELVEED